MVTKNYSSDIVIIGGGLAAIKAAYESAKSGLKVTVIVKSVLASGSSFYPMMDSVACQCTANNPDDAKLFLEEIEDSSLSMNDSEMCKLYIDNIRQRVEEFPEIGITPQKLQEEKVACFAKRPRDIFFWGGWNTIRNNVKEIFNQFSNLTLLENTSAIGIMKDNESINGVLCINKDNEFITITAKSIILATGGYGDLYKHSLNTSDISGDGHIMALEAGADLINLEFIQFIPGFFNPVYKVVFREGTLVHCNSLPDEDGHDVLEEYLPSKQDREECLNIRALHGPFTCRTIAKYFDIAMMNQIINSQTEKGFRLKYSKSILEDPREVVQMYIKWLKDTHGIDIVNDEIYIAPFYHAANGGIQIDHKCETAIEGVFAAGEAAGGIHGADRHGGNATGSCLVFGKIAAENAIMHAKSKEVKPIDDSQVNNYIFNHLKGISNTSIEPLEVIKTIKKIMWYHANIIRNEQRLKEAISAIETLRANYDASQFLDNPKMIKQAIKANHFIKLSSAILNAMLLRKESRGAHYREDYPEMDEAFSKRIISRLTNMGELEFLFE